MQVYRFQIRAFIWIITAFYLFLTGLRHRNVSLCSETELIEPTLLLVVYVNPKHIQQLGNNQEFGLLYLNNYFKLNS